MLSAAEIEALIRLLDDDDSGIYQHVKTKLVEQGQAIVPQLENAWGLYTEPQLHERIEEVIHEIHHRRLLQEFASWLEKPEPDLLTGALLMCKPFYPEMSLEAETKKVFRLKQDIWLELNNNQTPLEQVQVFNQVFFGIKNFSGEPVSNDNFQHCLNHVMETRKGNSISLGILYQILANELDLPIYGVRLRNHYVLAFLKYHPDQLSELNERDILFYINPVNRGSIFSRQEIKEYLKKMDISEEEEYFLPSGNEAIIAELLHLLIENNSGNRKLKQDLMDLKALLPFRDKL